MPAPSETEPAGEAEQPADQALDWAATPALEVNAPAPDDLTALAATPAPDAPAPIQPPLTERQLKIHPKLGQVALLSTAVWTVVSYTAVAIPLTVVFWRHLSVLFLLALLAPLVLVACLWLVLARTRAYRVAVVPDGMVIHRGAWWRSETFVPGSRIQHTDVTQGPLDRKWGMARLVVHTAGSEFGAVGVPGLYHGDAVALRDELLGRTGGDGV